MWYVGAYPAIPPKAMSAKQKALEKQEKNEAARTARAAEEAEKASAAQWSVGAKDSARARQNEEKEAERRRKAAEKAALEAAEDAELSGVTRKGIMHFFQLRTVLTS